VDVSFIVLQILAAHRTCMIESFRVTGSRCSLRACFRRMTARIQDTVVTLRGHLIFEGDSIN
jgi:hypothetical protein